MMERRWTSKVEIRASQGDEGAMIISGYAARWNTLSQNLGNGRSGGFRETLSPGCFTRSLQSDRQVACLFNHDASAVLGTKRSGTLKVEEDHHGLKFRCNVAPTTLGRDVYTLIQRRDIQDCSFSFEIDGPDGESWDDDYTDPDTGERMALRTVKRAKLHDCSVVQAPAYDGTQVEVDDDTDDDNIFEFNSMRRSIREYFPEGVPVSFPMEIRARLLAAQPDSGKQARRRNLINFVIS